VLKTSIIIPCKNRLHFLKATLKTIIFQKYDYDYEIIVVDYNCPQKTISYCESLNNPKVKSIFAEVERNEWNLSKARNLGFLNSDGEYILFLDADTILNDTFLEKTILRMKEGIFITGQDFKPHHSSGSCLVNRKDFELVKGYNESMNGWGSEDLELYSRLKQNLKQEYFDLKLIKNIPHNNNIRNQYHGGRNIFETNQHNWDISKNSFQSILR